MQNLSELSDKELLEMFSCVIDPREYPVNTDNRIELEFKIYDEIAARINHDEAIADLISKIRVAYFLLKSQEECKELFNKILRRMAKNKESEVCSKE